MKLLSPFRFSSRLVLQATALALAAGFSAQAQTNFFEDFESGNLNNWSVIPGASTLDILSTNKVPASGGTYAAKFDNSLDRMYANNIPSGMSITNGSFKLTFWMYDAGGGRGFGEARSYTTPGFSATAADLAQLIAVGKNNTTTPAFFTNNGVPEGYDSAKYQGRVAFGTPAGYFNVSNVARSTAWHRFDVERGTNTDGTVNLDFYIDGTFGRRLTNTLAKWGPQVWNSISVGFGAGSTAGDLYFDGFQVVQGQPWISQQPAPLTNYVGNDFTLTVAVIGVPGTIYQWKKNGANFAGATNLSLTFTNGQASNSGSYTLFASNQLGTATSLAAYLQINPFNLVTVPPTNQIVNVGDPVSFYAEGTTTSGTLYYQWNHNGTPIPGATDTGASSTYSIGTTTTNDAGAYTVTVTNSAGNPPTTSPTATLIVNTPPVVPTIVDQNATLNNYFSFAPTITDDLDVQSKPFQNFETNSLGATVTFANPHFSGTTTNMVDTTGHCSVTNNFPSGHGSSKTLRVAWNWTNGNVLCWLRLSTAGGGVTAGGNPIVSFNSPLRFDVFVDRDVTLAVGDRETSSTGAIGTSGGTSGPIEWLGVGGPGAPPASSTSILASNWTTVSFDTNAGVASFSTGNGILESATGKGVLEHLALRPADQVSIGQYTMYLDNFVSPPANALQFILDSGPSGAVMDPYTGNVNWMPTAVGTYGFNFHVTDTRNLTASGSFNVQVSEAVNPPGSITITPSGTSVLLNWSGSFPLQSATSVTGPYNDVNPPVTTEPYLVPATNSALFFRLRSN